ncbi:transthyretin [Panus rudis PR-1116 ss-1]|nr:transthyretin [Panus rudis PR-1116 ss-1]
MSKSPITCHVLDSSLGKPAQDVQVTLQVFHHLSNNASVCEPLAESRTNSDGRCMDLWPEATETQSKEERSKLETGKLYKVVFQTKEYFEKTGRKCFYPWVEITFEVENPSEHYHIPLLISPYSFTTYRGS